MQQPQPPMQPAYQAAGVNLSPQPAYPSSQSGEPCMSLPLHHCPAPCGDECACCVVCAQTSLHARFCSLPH
eukprot:scaffold316613_cov17-Tisochrysis_lutea.AAC.2